MYKTKKIAHSLSLLGFAACIGFSSSSLTAGVLSVNASAQSTYAKTKISTVIYTWHVWL